MSEQVPIAIGVDVGGSGIKGAAVDLVSGRLASNRHRILTPQPATPQACLEVIARIVKAVCRELPAAATAPVGVGVPSVVIGGATKTAANIDAGWVGFDAQGGLQRLLRRPVHMVNDADAAGLAEMRFGAGVDKDGTVIVLTLGTGVGSGFFVDGRLVPNTELGHMEIRGRDAERRSAAAARTRRGLSWKAWAEDLDEHLNAIHRLFWPSLLILGGGVSKNADKFIPRLTVPTTVVPATLRNEAGIVGAALFAAEVAREMSQPIPIAAPEAGSEAAEDEAKPPAEAAAPTASDEEPTASDEEAAGGTVGAAGGTEAAAGGTEPIEARDPLEPDTEVVAEQAAVDAVRDGSDWAPAPVEPAGEAGRDGG
ncbi:MAG TPA: ROK family protein, partial [Candidatus Dormibacteraeota bacterium]|nr:ROK family protein [Candidatus Dormibacteraeota bacterium]